MASCFVALVSVLVGKLAGGAARPWWAANRSACLVVDYFMCASFPVGNCVDHLVSETAGRRPGSQSG